MLLFGLLHIFLPISSLFFFSFPKRDISILLIQNLHHYSRHIPEEIETSSEIVSFFQIQILFFFLKFFFSLENSFSSGIFLFSMEIFLLFPESLKVPQKCFFNLKILNYSHICSGIFFKKKSSLFPYLCLNIWSRPSLYRLQTFLNFQVRA